MAADLRVAIEMKSDEDTVEYLRPIWWCSRAQVSVSVRHPSDRPLRLSSS